MYLANGIGQDLNNDGNIANERVSFAPRNGIRLPAFATLDLRGTKDVPLWPESRVQLKLIGEAFNLTNRTNITWPERRSLQRKPHQFRVPS